MKKLRHTRFYSDKQEKSEPESDQYKRINKQLDKLIALMSEKNNIQK